MKLKHLLLGLPSILCVGNAVAATNINTPTVSGVWTVQNSPYYIYNDITVPLNSSLQIKPGVEVIFMGNYQITAEGRFTAIGSPEQKVTFKANDITGWENRMIPDGGWKGIYIMNQDIPSLNEPTLEHCIFRDIKNLQGTGINSISQNMYINHCDFFHNYTSGLIVASIRFGNDPFYNSNSKLKFTNNNLYDNYAGTIMHNLQTDSVIISHNKFYNNQSQFHTYAKNTFHDTSTNVFIFEHNEMYDNTVQENAAILDCGEGGYVYIRNNKFYRNSTTLKGAVSVQSIKALIDGNYIANNNRTQKGGFLCGINDGGAGLHLLGQTVITDKPDWNIFTVSNNVIVNNHSDINGAGIWANHCKVNIVNNTIMNNTADSYGAGVHGWGRYCKVNVQNNIIHGNKSNPPYDTGYYTFNFSPLMLDVTVSNNLIEYTYSTAPANIMGLAQNTYTHNLSLLAPTSGAGLTYDALNADFSPVAASLNIINKGNNNAPDHGNYDYLGNPRISGNSIDIGAIEFSGNPSGIANNPLRGQIKLYPVPAQQTINLENNTGKAIKMVQLFNMNGQLLEVPPAETGKITQFNLEHIAKGAYYIMLTLSDGQQVAQTFSVQ
ncbi:MAG: T9SS type A sorting domain-containing protein [Sphingobacteriales bacterium]|nr:MAG: T9SS type A sorting domain-containing protein [Sphingobacteriales bacterium]